MAPELIDAEVLNTLARFERAGIMTEAQARHAIGAFVLAPVERIPHASLVARAWERRANLSTYDALYVALATRLGCPLITADTRLAASPNLGITVTLVPTDP